MSDPVLVGGFREAVVQAAASELGASNSHVADYWRDVLPPGASPPFPPQWCGAFDLWCLRRAGVADGIHWAIGRGFLLTGPCPLTTTINPQPGDTSYLAVPFQHHAIVEGVDADGTVHTIDGNQGASAGWICRRSHKRGSGHIYFSISPLINRAVVALGVRHVSAE